MKKHKEALNNIMENVKNEMLWRLENEYQRGYDDGKKEYMVDTIKQSDFSYQRGYEDGKKAVEEQAEKITYTDIDEAYQRGLEQAWKCGKRIANETSVILSKIFGEISPSAVFQQYSPQEAMQKIKEYEERQTEEELVTQKHHTIPVTLHITKVSKHISNIDLDEERQTEEERQTGKWIGLYVGDGEVKYECSVCGFIASGKWKYCCECGADMRKESE